MKSVHPDMRGGYEPFLYGHWVVFIRLCESQPLLLEKNLELVGVPTLSNKYAIAEGKDSQ